MPGSVNCSFNGLVNWQPSLIKILTPGTDALTIGHGLTSDFLAHYDTCFALLNAQEQTTALRYYQLKDQQRYVIQHGLLRLLLGQYLNTSPHDIAYTYNPTKKPYLVSGNCFFNLSHSRDGFLIAIGNVEVGVDIEYINNTFAYSDIVSNYFSADEVAYINNATNQTEAFFLLWTRKEALLKACGTGIDDNLPAMPALNGQRDLPADYPQTDYLTQSFYISNNFMGSLTYTSPQRELNFGVINAMEIARLFNAG
jgi:4'-phosphopantetheinyl transferase